MDPGAQRRLRHGDSIKVSRDTTPRPVINDEVIAANPDRPLRIYPYAISRDSVERVLRDLRLNARTVPRAENADFIIALRSRADDPRLQRLLSITEAPLHVVRKNTTAQIRRLLQGMLHGQPEDNMPERVAGG